MVGFAADLYMRVLAPPLPPPLPPRFPDLGSPPGTGLDGAEGLGLREAGEV
jgi:hypothetical protein